jgi:hypothetical protein
MRPDPTPAPLTKRSGSTWTNNNPCAEYAKQMYLCLEVKSPSSKECNLFKKEYKECMNIENYYEKRMYERYQKNISSPFTAGFSVHTIR